MQGTPWKLLVVGWTRSSLMGKEDNDKMLPCIIKGFFCWPLQIVVLYVEVSIIDTCHNIGMGTCVEPSIFPSKPGRDVSP
jgi:hypothetical protein